MQDFSVIIKIYLPLKKEQWQFLHGIQIQYHLKLEWLEKSASKRCFSERRRRHFRKFCAFARFSRRDVIMAMIIGSAKSDVLTPPSWPPPLCAFLNKGIFDCRLNSNSSYYFQLFQMRTTKAKCKIWERKQTKTYFKQFQLVIFY